MKFERFLSACPLVFWPFTMLLHFSLKKKTPKFASATTRKRGLIASCCTAFCRKTHRNMHQNAVHFAPKRKVKCSKMRGKMQQKRGKMQQDATKINKETAF